MVKISAGRSPQQESYSCLAKSNSQTNESKTKDNRKKMTRRMSEDREEKSGVTSDMLYDVLQTNDTKRYDERQMQGEQKKDDK